MGVETIRIGYFAAAGLALLYLTAGRRLACRLYAAAIVNGRDRRARVWGFIAAG